MRLFGFLGDDAAAVTTTSTNTSSQALPCGTGYSVVSKGTGSACQQVINCVAAPCPQMPISCPVGYTMTDNGCIVTPAPVAAE